jgi:hypothetical protein
MTLKNTHGFSPPHFVINAPRFGRRRPRRIVAPLFVMALSCGAISSAWADGVAPGLWKVTETVIMNGTTTPAQVKNRCLSSEEAGNTAKTFTPEYRTVNSDCERTEFTSTATRLKWRMQCKGQMDMDVAGDFTFDTTNHYTATISSKASIGGRQVVDTSVAIEGEQIGECR